MTSDQSIEQEIQAKGLTAPRVTPADLEAAIVSEHYFTAGDGFAGALAISPSFENLPEEDRVVSPPEQLDLLTFCVLVLHNGFTVTGESACASPENFDAEVGRKRARDDAKNKLWPLMWHALKSSLQRS